MKAGPREYRAIIWTKDPLVPGLRVTVWATSAEQARKVLEAQHGEGTVFDLHNPDDAQALR